MKLEEPEVSKSTKNSPPDTENDMVNHPEHYMEGGIETLDYLKAKSNPVEFMGYLRLNCLKYLSRAPYKGSGVMDLKKCFFYLNALINELENHPSICEMLNPGGDTKEYLEKLADNKQKTLTPNNFIQRQLEISEELFKVMKQDFNERSKDLGYLEKTCTSLLSKLDKANQEIKELRNGNQKGEYYGA